VESPFARFLCESERLKKHDRQRQIAGEGTTSHGKFPFRVWSLDRVIAEPR
jgi:hypothetical protein